MSTPRCRVIVPCLGQPRAAQDRRGIVLLLQVSLGTRCLYRRCCWEFDSEDVSESFVSLWLVQALKLDKLATLRNWDADPVLAVQMRGAPKQPRLDGLHELRQ